MLSIPKHVAIIMDGNRRWARKRGLPSVAGHRQGVRNIESILEGAKDIGIKFLTLYTFSTENWKRSKGEVDALMKLLGRYMDRESSRLIANGIKMVTIGDLGRFTPALRQKIEKIKKASQGNTALTLNLALNYGSRDEILRAARRIAKAAGEGVLEASDVTEKLFSGYLDTAGMPDPDLLIRTGGEKRISNFLLWQIPYAELHITKKLWPDFTEKDLKNTVAEYMKRERRLGF